MIDRNLNGKSHFVSVGSTPTANTRNLSAPALNMINIQFKKVCYDIWQRMSSLFSYAINRSVWDNYSALELAASHGRDTSMTLACMLCGSS